MTDSDVQKVCDALGVKPFEYDCDIFATPDICGYTPQSNDCSACGRATPVYPAGAVLLEALKAALIKRETMWGIEWMPNVRCGWPKFRRVCRHRTRRARGRLRGSVLQKGR
jgi:hypothetical protein